jgi:hypothetical protein
MPQQAGSNVVGGFKPGFDPRRCLGGKPKGVRSKNTLLWEALEREGKKRGLSFQDHLAQLAFENPTVARDILPYFFTKATPDEAPERQVIVVYPPDWKRLDDAVRLRDGSNGHGLSAASHASETLGVGG